MKNLTAAQDHEKISSIISLLTYDFALSPSSNHRKVRCCKLLEWSEIGFQRIAIIPGGVTSLDIRIFIP